MSKLKLFCNCLTPELVKKAKEELGETEEIKLKTLKQLKDLIKTEPDFYPCIDDSFLLRYLRARKFNVEKAFKLLRNYYKFKAHQSGIVTDLKPSDVTHVLDAGYITFLDDRDEDGAAVLYFGVGKLQNFDPFDIYETGLILGEVALLQEATQICGIVGVEDCADLTMSGIRRYASPTFQHAFAIGLQDCLPARVKGYHMVNESYAFNAILRITKMFLSEKLKKRIHFHGSNTSSLRKHFPAEILPDEVGGLKGPIKHQAELLKAKLLSMEDHFVRMSQYGYRGETLQKIKNSDFKWYHNNLTY